VQVEGVEGLAADEEINPLRDVRPLTEADIDILEGEAAEAGDARARAIVSDAREGRLIECSSVEERLALTRIVAAQ